MKLNITPASPSNGNSSDLDVNVPVKNTELDVWFSCSDKDKFSTIETGNLSAEIHTEVFGFNGQNSKYADFSDSARKWVTGIPNASKEFVPAKVLKSSVQARQVETDWQKSSQGTESGIKEKPHCLSACFADKIQNG